MTADVEWLEPARCDVRMDLIPQFEDEIRRAFPEAEVITVCHCLAGYSQAQERRIILGLQVRSAKDYRMHTVKLGERKAVEGDFRGWQNCLLNHNVASHIFLRVESRDIGSEHRLAIVYEDAYTFYGRERREPRAQSLETVFRDAVERGDPDVRSVERVVRQLFSELSRCLYRDARPKANPAREFYLRKLRFDGQAEPNVHAWAKDDRRNQLRRDLCWISCGLDACRTDCQPIYMDPHDYLCWAVAKETLPCTLIGRSHGDLHGRNVLVGVERGEAEFPLVFDYGDMDVDNALVWDFVKLETELKVRILLPLYKDPSAREALLRHSRSALKLSDRIEQDCPSAESDTRIVRARRTVFACEFESILAQQSSCVNWMDDALSPDPPGGRTLTGHGKIDRALSMILRIRQEAAVHLGELHRYHGAWESWQDEYNFALVVYGLCTAKFDYMPFESEFALVSAGVAAAHMSTVSETIRDLIDRRSVPKGPYPCYGVPLAHAHRLWKTGDKGSINRAVRLLKRQAKTFSHALPLLQEYGLLLLEDGKHRESLDVLRPLVADAKLIRDHETLAHIGRAWKDEGDKSLEKVLVSFDRFSRDVPRHPAWQFYHMAQDPYKAAYELSGHYYPGVNYATLAYLLGHQDESKRVANEVLRICSDMLAPDDWFWILATEGEASLLIEEPEGASNFYTQALRQLESHETGMVQSAYTQLCRLWWALGEDRVATVLQAFKSFPKIWQRLKPGPLGDCDHARS